MRLALLSLLVLPVVVAEDPKIRRLESVTWNSVDHTLTWVISQGGKESGGKYKAAKSMTYVIQMDEATMNFNGEGRRFSKTEAQNVRVLMDLVSKYAVESTLWWEQGNGAPIGKDRDEKVKSDQPKPHQPKSPRPGVTVAALR